MPVDLGEYAQSLLIYCSSISVTGDFFHYIKAASRRGQPDEAMTSIAARETSAPQTKLLSTLRRHAETHE